MVLCGACGRRDEPAAAATPTAATASPRTTPGTAPATPPTGPDVPLRLHGFVAPDAQVDKAYAAVAAVAAGRCPVTRTPGSSDDYDAHDGKAPRIAIACGSMTDETWLLAVTDPDAVPVALLGGKRIDHASTVAVDELYASDRQLCVEYSIRTAEGKKTSGYRHCMAKSGAPIADADPVTAEPAQPLPSAPPSDALAREAEAAVAAQSAGLCQEGDLANATARVAKDGPDEIVAAACADPKSHKIEVGLLERQRTELTTRAFTRVLDADAVTFTGFTTAAHELCVDLTAAPTSEHRQLCLRRDR
jgi:hypothetical protein